MTEKKYILLFQKMKKLLVANFDANDENAITPNKMLTFFNSGYKYAWDIPQNLKGRKIQFIKLTPNSNSKDTTKRNS